MVNVTLPPHMVDGGGLVGLLGGGGGAVQLQFGVGRVLVLEIINSCLVLHVVRVADDHVGLVHGRLGVAVAHPADEVSVAGRLVGGEPGASAVPVRVLVGEEAGRAG